MNPFPSFPLWETQEKTPTLDKQRSGGDEAGKEVELAVFHVVIWETF
jgi:hypothetical protein